MLVSSIAVEGTDMKLLLTSFLCCFTLVFAETDPGDVQVLNDFRKGLSNPDLLQWPHGDDDPCGKSWPHVYCSGNRVSQIQVQRLGLEGQLPPNFNKLSKLQNLGFQNNNLSGPLPSFSGLSELQYAYLGNNRFDTIPSDFFDSLNGLRVMSLDFSPLNKSTGWILPDGLRNSIQLVNLSLMGCNLMGPLPAFLGKMPSLTTLKLAYNMLTGSVPASYRGAQFQVLWLNNQGGEKLSGSIEVVASMLSLRVLWLHGNSFIGTIPVKIGDCTGLTELFLNDNQLVGPVPVGLASLPLNRLRIDNNMLTGPIPKLKIAYSYYNNHFCQSDPGNPCSREVTLLLDFLAGINYPLNLAESWSGDNPCSNWLGIACSGGKVSSINLPRYHLNGTLSPLLGHLDSIVRIQLRENNLHGPIPRTLITLKSLRLLDLSSNNFGPPLPQFGAGVRVILDGNPKLTSSPAASPSPSKSPSPGKNPMAPSDPQPPSGEQLAPTTSPGSNSGDGDISPASKKPKVVSIAIPVACVGGALLAGLVVFAICKKKRASEASSSVVVHPKDPYDPYNVLKIVVTNSNNVSSSATTTSSSQSLNSRGTNEAHLNELGNFHISTQVLRDVTGNFSPENELGRGGFGTVYKGELDDGSYIAVKRMEASVISNKASAEFQAEIAVLSKVRHRHLVALLGYSIEENEKLLVYEYMSQGALSKHLLHWKKLQLEPLSWKRRLNIALDVARGMEYLHSLAHQSFIHRDLKSSNILLGDDYRAKVSDFGLVKLAPDGKQSVATRLAGTFGYLAPEYAVTGKVTTKVDVFSYGVVLMELVTGLAALDERREEESRYLVEWFWRMKSSRDKLTKAIDPALYVTEETFESIFAVAELAGHCTTREPSQRPDMGYVVSVLAPMIQKWKPTYSDQEDYMGIDVSRPLHQLVKDWKEADGQDSMTSLENNRGSIPSRPTRFGECFTSADGQ